MHSALCLFVSVPFRSAGASLCPIPHTSNRVRGNFQLHIRKSSNNANLIGSLIMGGDGVYFETEGKTGIASTTQMKRGK